MKYKECPDCGAHLDPCEVCSCKKEEDTPDAAGEPSKDVNAINETSLSNLFPNVNDCFRLREVRELTGVQAKDLSKLVQARFPKFTRQIMSQCESYDKYGCLPHPDVLRIICDAYDIKLDNKPVHKGENYKRKLDKKVTLRMTEKDFEWLQSQVEHDDYPSVQAWLYAKIKEWRGVQCPGLSITQQSATWRLLAIRITSRSTWSTARTAARNLLLKTGSLTMTAMRCVRSVSVTGSWKI